MLRKFWLIVIGSSLVSNSLYIYGLSYYQGYITGLGFEYNLFPIEWSDTLIWTYFASRELGASTINVWVTLTQIDILMILLTVYIVTRLWIAIDGRRKKPNEKPMGIILSTIICYLKKLKERYPKSFKYSYPPIQWLLIKEQSFWAFTASYFFFIGLVFTPVFIFIWVYFPMVGINHGELISKGVLSKFDTSLCNDSKKYWNQCIVLPTNNINLSKIDNPITGRLIIKNGNLLGLITENGPLDSTR